MDQFRPRKRPNPIEKARGLTGMAMGIIYILVGIFMFVANQKKMLHLGNTFTYIAASLVILYGGFRVWRGWYIRKNADR